MGLAIVGSLLINPRCRRATKKPPACRKEVFLKSTPFGVENSYSLFQKNLLKNFVKTEREVVMAYMSNGYASAFVLCSVFFLHGLKGLNPFAIVR